MEEVVVVVYWFCKGVLGMFFFPYNRDCTYVLSAMLLILSPLSSDPLEVHWHCWQIVLVLGLLSYLPCLGKELLIRWLITDG